MRTSLRPAYYALQPGAWRDYVTLLHPPYTVWHLSYVVLGSAAAPVVHLDRLAGTLLAFFLAVGLGAHALDEYQGRPLRTHISDTVLLSIAFISVGGALLIGAVATVTISYWAAPFVLFGGFMVVAYNLELFGGRFHGDLRFAIAWGAFPAIAGYWANAERLAMAALLVAAACAAASLAQRSLSKRAGGLRRRVREVSGRVEFDDGRVENISLQYLVSAPETALRLIGAGCNAPGRRMAI